MEEGCGASKFHIILYLYLLNDMYVYLVELGGGGQVEEDAAVLYLHGEGQQLHVLVVHVVHALTTKQLVGSRKRCTSRSRTRKTGRQADK